MALRIKGSSGVTFGALEGSSISGFYGKKYSGYFSDNVNFFDTASQTDFIISTSISSFGTSGYLQSSGSGLVTLK